jgi:hypothetical protein
MTEIAFEIRNKFPRAKSERFRKKEDLLNAGSGSLFLGQAGRYASDGNEIRQKFNRKSYSYYEHPFVLPNLN